MTAQTSSALAGYRDAVAELVSAGEPFGEIEEAIDEVPDLTMDQKSALWLFAFALADPSGRQLKPAPGSASSQ